MTIGRYDDESAGGIYAVEPRHIPQDPPHVAEEEIREAKMRSILSALFDLLRDAGQQGYAVEITLGRTWWRRIFGIGGRKIRIGRETPVRIEVRRA